MTKAKKEFRIWDKLSNSYWHVGYPDIKSCWTTLKAATKAAEKHIRESDYSVSDVEIHEFTVTQVHRLK
jgi:hypothetical protein